MPDFKFKVVGVQKAARYSAARYVLFDDVCDGELARVPRKGVAAKLSAKMRSMWRGVVNKLRSANWGRADTQGKVQFMRNCPPVGVMTDQASRRCGLNLICPFCYVRNNVLLNFRRMERVLWADKRGPYDKWLIEFSSTLPQSDIDAYVKSNTKHKDRMSAVLCAMEGAKMAVRQPSLRLKEREAVPAALGGLVLHRIMYYATGLPSPSRSGALIVPAGTMPDFGTRGESFSYKVHENVTKKCLSSVFSRTCRFPIGWLKYAEPVEIVAYLHKFARVRMLSTFGCLYGVK